jgi:hypothetical protein
MARSLHLQTRGTPVSNSGDHLIDPSLAVAHIAPVSAMLNRL